MKISISLTLFILVAAAGFGWQLEGQFAAARKDASHLTSETARLGIAVIDPLTPRTSKRVRVDHKAVAKQLADEYIQLSKLAGKDGKFDQASQARFDECLKQISALDADSLKNFCGVLLVSEEELSEKKRLERLDWSLRILLAQKNPHAALEFVLEHSAEVKKTDGFGNVIHTALVVMAKDDPQTAADWLTKNSSVCSPSRMPFFRKAIWCSAAEKNPSAAFPIVASFGLSASEVDSAMIDIVTTAKTEEEMTNTLAALREYRTTIESNKIYRDAVDDSVGYLSDNFRKTSFAVADKWVREANLNPRELSEFCSRLSGGNMEDTGKWIEWMDTVLPVEKSSHYIYTMFLTWTRDDYEAAGKWLTTAREGPARNAAIQGYVMMILKHDLPSAIQWATTLPPGKKRDNTLKAIHAKLPKDDETAKEAFAKEHGIK